MPDELVWENAKISDAFIGIEDHGIFAFCITFSGGGWSQGTGAYVFCPNKVEKICRTFGPWSDLEGKLVRVGRNSSGRIMAIRDIMDDDKEVVFNA